MWPDLPGGSAWPNEKLEDLDPIEKLEDLDPICSLLANFWKAFSKSWLVLHEQRIML